MADLSLKLPEWRPARITAEVVLGKHGSLEYYVYADKRCVQQGTHGTPELAAQHVRDVWKIEPRIVHRKETKA